MERNYTQEFLTHIVKVDGNAAITQLLFGRIQPMLVADITFARHDLKPRISAKFNKSGLSGVFQIVQGYDKCQLSLWATRK